MSLEIGVRVICLYQQVTAKRQAYDGEGSSNLLSAVGSPFFIYYSEAIECSNVMANPLQLENRMQKMDMIVDDVFINVD